MMKMALPIGIKMYNPVEDIFPIQRDIDDHIDDFEKCGVV